MMNSKKEQRSQMWQEIQSYGNPDNLKWTSSDEDKINSIRNILYMHELQKYVEFEPFFVTPLPLPEDYFDVDLFYEPNMRLISEVLEDHIRGVRATDFPVEWGYFDDILKEQIRYFANDFTVLDNQLKAFQDKGSNLFDFEIDENKFEFIKLKTKEKKVIDKDKRVQKSKKGKGNDYESCNIIDNEFIYCPPSEKCLIDCLSYNKPCDDTMMGKINLFLKSKSVYRYNISSCNVSDVAKIIGVKFNLYRKKRQELRYKYEQGQIILCLLNSHWIILKDHKNLNVCYQYAKNNIVWTEKILLDCSLETQKQTSKFFDCTDDERFGNTWIQDFEAYPDDQTGQFVPYATGFAQLNDIYKFHSGQSKLNCPTQYVDHYDGSECIMKMLMKIDGRTKKLSKQYTDKKGVIRNVTQKQNVYIYAHNGSNFDSYFYLNVQDLKCKKMIEKGGIMSMTIVSTLFKNANFIIKDTRKFLTSSLKNLCKSFNIDEKYSKSEIEHTKINKTTWEGLKSVWLPYLELDVVSLSLIWIKFIEKMRMIVPSIDIKNYCSIAQLSYSVACKDQLLPAFVDPQVRKFIQRANRGGRVIARNQYFKTQNINEILEINGAKSIDQLVGQVVSAETLALLGQDYHIAFDATSLYPSAMSLPHASYLDAEQCFNLSEEECSNFKPEQWQEKKFIIECDLIAPKHLQFVPLSIKTKYGAQFSTGRLSKIVVNDVDLFECLRFGYHLDLVYQGIWSKPIQYEFIKDFVEMYFNERSKVKSVDSVLGDLYKLILNSAYGKFGQKRCEYQVKFTTRKEMENENLYTDDVIDCVQLGNGQICYKVYKEQKDGENLSPHHIAGYILAYSKQIMNNFVLQIGAEKENLISYMDTDSFYIHSKDFSKLAHIKDCLGGGKNDYGETKMIIQADYLGCKSKVCYLLDTKTMMISKKVTWKGISLSKFQQIDQEVVNEVKRGGLEEDKKNDNYYIGDIDNWSRSKKNGVSIQYGCKKILSISQYCQKYDLIDGVYHFKHLE